MGNEAVYALVSVALVSLVSLGGIVLLSLTPATLGFVVIFLVSFSSGTLFGDAFIHLLPEIVAREGFTIWVSLFTLCGVGGSFVMEKVIHWRHDHSPAQEEGIEVFAHMNLLGDAVHNFLDGAVIVGAYAVDVGVGIATTIAILFHEIPQEMGDFGVLVHGGISRTRALFLNFMTALVGLLGALLTILFIGLVEHLILFLIPFAAGTFIYIAGSDLIPQLHKEKEVRYSLLQLLFFALGIAVMVLLRWTTES